MYTRQGRDSTQGVTIHAMAAQVPPASMKAYYRELISLDASKALKNLKSPLMFVGTEKRWPAEKDWPAIARELGYADAAGITSHRLGSCGTLVASEQPDSLADLIRGFTTTVLAKK